MHADWKKRSERTQTNDTLALDSLVQFVSPSHTHNGTFEVRIEYYFVDANKEYNYTMPIQTMILNKKHPTSQPTNPSHTQKQESE